MENNNGIVNPAINPEAGGKTFTQEQVNAIVSKRLAEDRAAHSAELNKRESELKAREMQLKAKEILAAHGLPDNLASVLKYDDEESLTAAVEVLQRTKGFKNKEEETSARKVIPCKLPEVRNDYPVDTLRKAMGLD